MNNTKKKLLDLIDTEISMEDLPESIASLSLMDDALSSVAFSQNGPYQIRAAQKIIDIILGRDDLKVIEILSQQRRKKDLQSKMIVIDLLAITESGSHVRIELQNRKNPDMAKRKLYYLAQDVSHMLGSSERYENLQELISIWINDFDEHQAGSGIYYDQIHTSDDKGNLVHKNENYLGISVSANLLRKADSLLGQLMRDMAEPDPGRMEFDELKELLIDTKTNRTEEVRKIMTWAEEIQYENTVHNAVEMVKSMKESDLPADTIKLIVIRAIPEINIKEIFELAGVSEG